MLDYNSRRGFLLASYQRPHGLAGFSINLCKVILVYCTVELSIAVEKHLLYKMDLMQDKMYGVEAGSSCSKMVTCPQELKSFSIKPWSLLHTGACWSGHSPNGWNTLDNEILGSFPSCSLLRLVLGKSR